MGRIVITGMGIVTAIGQSVAENRYSLMNGKCGISHIEFLSTYYAGILPAGEIKISTNQLKETLNVHEPGTTRTSLLALHALQQAVEAAGFIQSQLQSPDTAFINASTVGGLCLTDEMYQDSNAINAGSEYVASYDSASIALFLQDRYKIGGLVNTINTACSSSANAVMYGARLIKHGLAKRAIVGGVDSLAKYTVNGFNSLRILSSHLCSPFDANREGLNLGEGSAYIVLEKEEDVQQKNIYAVLSGYANTTDSFHPSALSPDGHGPFLAMQKALQIAGLQPSDISFINAHGTATENNDEVESVAMRRLFGKPPMFASTKANTGHTLAASGAIEAVFSILNLQHQELYPALQFQEPIASTGFVPVLEYQQKPLQHIMSNSFGFGGNCSSLIFSKV